MSTIIVWLLIITSDGGSNRGNVLNVERFATQGDCEWVRARIPGKDSGSLKSSCIQAKIIQLK